MSYMVSVEGGNAPTVIHKTYASAQMEAERVANLLGDKSRAIHVLKIVSIFKPVTTYQWEHQGEQQ